MQKKQLFSAYYRIRDFLSAPSRIHPEKFLPAAKITKKEEKGKKP